MDTENWTEDEIKEFSIKLYKALVKVHLARVKFKCTNEELQKLLKYEDINMPIENLRTSCLLFQCSAIKMMALRVRAGHSWKNFWGAPQWILDLEPSFGIVERALQVERLSLSEPGAGPDPLERLLGDLADAASVAAAVEMASNSRRDPGVMLRHFRPARELARAVAMPESCLHAAWIRLFDEATSGARALWAAGDGGAGAGGARGIRLTVVQWQVVDIALYYGAEPVHVTQESLTDEEKAEALRVLLDLVAEASGEEEAEGDREARELRVTTKPGSYNLTIESTPRAPAAGSKGINISKQPGQYSLTIEPGGGARGLLLLDAEAERAVWAHVHAAYTRSGRRASALTLQWRWLGLSMQAAYLTAGSAPPHPLLYAALLRFPWLAEMPPSWRQLRNAHRLHCLPHLQADSELPSELQVESDMYYFRCILEAAVERSECDRTRVHSRAECEPKHSEIGSRIDIKTDEDCVSIRETKSSVAAASPPAPAPPAPVSATPAPAQHSTAASPAAAPALPEPAPAPPVPIPVPSVTVKSATPAPALHAPASLASASEPPAPAPAPPSPATPKPAPALPSPAPPSPATPKPAPLAPAPAPASTSAPPSPAPPEPTLPEPTPALPEPAHPETTPALPASEPVPPQHALPASATALPEPALPEPTPALPASAPAPPEPALLASTPALPASAPALPAPAPTPVPPMLVPPAPAPPAAAHHVPASPTSALSAPASLEHLSLQKRTEYKERQNSTCSNRRTLAHDEKLARNVVVVLTRLEQQGAASAKPARVPPGVSARAPPPAKPARVPPGVSARAPPPAKPARVPPGVSARAPPPAKPARVPPGVSARAPPPAKPARVPPGVSARAPPPAEPAPARPAGPVRAVRSARLKRLGHRSALPSGFWKNKENRRLLKALKPVHVMLERLPFPAPPRFPARTSTPTPLELLAPRLPAVTHCKVEEPVLERERSPSSAPAASSPMSDVLVIDSSEPATAAPAPAPAPAPARWNIERRALNASDGAVSKKKKSSKKSNCSGKEKSSSLSNRRHRRKPLLQWEWAEPPLSPHEEWERQKNIMAPYFSLPACPLRPTPLHPKTGRERPTRPVSDIYRSMKDDPSAPIVISDDDEAPRSPSAAPPVTPPAAPPATLPDEIVPLTPKSSPKDSMDDVEPAPAGPGASDTFDPELPMPVIASVTSLAPAARARAGAGSGPGGEEAPLVSVTGGGALCVETDAPPSDTGAAGGPASIALSLHQSITVEEYLAQTLSPHNPVFRLDAAEPLWTLLGDFIIVTTDFLPVAAPTYWAGAGGTRLPSCVRLLLPPEPPGPHTELLVCECAAAAIKCDLCTCVAVLSGTRAPEPAHPTAAPAAAPTAKIKVKAFAKLPSDDDAVDAPTVIRGGGETFTRTSVAPLTYESVGPRGPGYGDLRVVNKALQRRLCGGLWVPVLTAVNSAGAARRLARAGRPLRCSPFRTFAAAPPRLFAELKRVLSEPDPPDPPAPP